MIPERDAALVDELRRKYAGRDTTNFGLLDFLSAFGSPVDAVMYLRLFWPQFVSFEGMVFRQEVLEDDEDRQRVLEALVRYADDKTLTEQSFNLVDVPCGVFSRHGPESSEDIDELLANSLVELWTHRLAAVFPGRRFIVETVPPEQNNGEQGVLFYTDRRDS